MADRTIEIRITGKNDATGALNSVGNSISSLGKIGVTTTGQLASLGAGIIKLGALGVAGIAGLGAGFVALGASAIGAGSDVSEMRNQFGIVFGKDVPAAEASINTFAAAVGRNKYELQGFATGIGAILGPMGLTQTQVTGMSTDFAKLAVDLSSFYNVTESEALESLRAGIIGETEPMRKFGVVINEAAIKQEALNLQLIRSDKDALSPAAKAQATYSLIMRQTAQAQGDAARTSGGWANATRALAGRLREAWQEIGLKLLPVVEPLLGMFNELAKSVLPVLVSMFDSYLLPVLKSLAETIAGLVSGKINLASLIPPELLTAVLALWIAIKDLAAIIFGDAVKSASSLGETLSSIVAPALGFLASTIIPALITVVNFVAENWESFRGALLGVAAVLGGSVIVAAISAVVGLLASLATPLMAIIAVAALLGAAWAGNWYGIRDTLTEVWNSVYPILVEVWNWLSVNVPLAIQTLANFFNNVLYPVFLAVFTQIQTVVNTVLTLITTWWKEHGDSVMVIVNGYLTFIGALIYGVLITIQAFWATWGDTIMGVVRVAWDFIKAYVSFAMAFIGAVIDAVAALIQGDWTKFGEALKAIWQALWDFQMAIFNAARDLLILAIDALIIYISGQWEAFKTTLTAIWESLWNGISSFLYTAIELLKRTISDLILVIENKWTTFRDNLSNWWTTAWNSIVQAITNAKDNVITKVNEIIEAIKSKFTVESFTGIGDMIIKGIVQGIEDGWDTVTALAKKLGDALIEAVKKKLGIASPSSVFAEIGQNITGGLAIGIAGGAGAVSSAMNNVTTNIVNNYTFNQTINGGVPSARQEFELMKSSALAFG